MANSKQRYINTKFWNDSYITRLDPVEKLMFIYLLTNEHTNISGVYEVPLKIIAIETGIDESMIKKIILRLKDKIRYIDGFVIIKNFIKHQETGSPLVEKGILNCLQDVDKEMLKKVVVKGYYTLPQVYSDTLSIPYIQGSNYSDLDSDLDSNSIAEKIPAKEFSLKEEIQKLMDSERRELRIIGWFIHEKKVSLKNKEQLGVTIRRHLRSAKLLIGFDVPQLKKAADNADRQIGNKWTLETLYKLLTK